MIDNTPVLVAVSLRPKFPSVTVAWSSVGIPQPRFHALVVNHASLTPKKSIDSGTTWGTPEDDMENDNFGVIRAGRISAGAWILQCAYLVVVVDVITHISSTY